MIRLVAGRFSPARAKTGVWIADCMAAARRYREFGFSTREAARDWEHTARVVRINRPPVSYLGQKGGGPKASLGGVFQHCVGHRWAVGRPGGH